MKNDVLKMIAQRAKRRLVGKENMANVKIKIIPNEDEIFNIKVEFLLSQDGVVSNPVKYLIDEGEMSGLTEEGRERFLLSTLDRYNNLRREIEALGALGKKVSWKTWKLCQKLKQTLDRQTWNAI